MKEFEEKKEMKKTQREWSLLDYIYKDIPGIEIEKTDKPDFTIKHKNDKFSFGVEVTEFYFSESSARLRNIPEYLEEIFDRKSYRHKDDKEALKLGKITIISEEGDRKEDTTGVIQKLPGITKYLEKIGLIIKTKNKKFHEYDKYLNHINLILYDTENYLFSIQHKNFSKIFFTEDITESIVKSEFREIYFITTVDKERKLIFPLKMILFVSRIYFFNHFLVSKYLTNSDLNEDESYDFFIEYLNHCGFSGLKKRQAEQKTEIIYGNVGFYMEGNKVTLKVYRDSRLPTDTQSRNIENYMYLDADAIKSINEHFGHMSFETEIGIEIKK